MKLKITFLFVGFLSLISFAQVQGPPAPCGYTVVYACDDDNDGFASFNLTEAFPFETFCRIDKGSPEDYYPIVYYETLADRDNETNPILNPEAYINIFSSQTIYYRANKKVPNQYIVYLSAYNFIEVSDLFATIPEIEVYDNNSDGLSVFDLTSVDLLCGSKDINDYNITYHLSQTDAEFGINPISNSSSFQNTINPQGVYVRAEHKVSGEAKTKNITLRVLFANAQNLGGVYMCDFDEEGQDGISEIDLTKYNAEILGNQDPNSFSVTYYKTQVDAETKVNVLPSIYTVSDQETIYARVEEYTKGSYAITSFSFTIYKPPLIELNPYEICDEDGDGKAIFDLAAVRNKIISDANNYQYYDIAFYLDANQQQSVSDQDNYTNISNPQTIYVDVEDWGNNYCYTVAPLTLVVKDCSQAGVIEANAFYDANTNTTFDTDEINFLNGTLTYEKNNDGIQHDLYSSTGVFNIISDDETNTYDITYTIDDEFQQCYNIATATYENINVAKGSKVNYNLPITKIQDCSDIAVYLVSFASPRPGFNYKNYLVVQNKGVETVVSGNVEFVQDASLVFDDVSYVDSGNSVTNTSTGFILNFNDLESNYSEIVRVNMVVPVNVNLGDMLTNTAIYSTDDLDISNNISTLTETVIGSYDPNDILESHGSEILHNSFTSDDYLYYTVRFQNVGTADAINVSIDNALNPKLDKSTIQMLNASHDYVFTRTDNQLNWKFNNIHLPSESMDEPNSHGYVYYKIKPLAGYSVGDIIPNFAEIYFDFNPAIVTNTFETEFVATLSNSQFDNGAFSTFPNPTNSFVELKFNNKVNNKIQVKVYDIQGKLIFSSNHELKNKAIQLDVSQLKSGLYFIKVSDANNQITKKLLIN
ncbi:T9SS type A sorting domain-containing protein [Mariniflexile aquimaris]|uniref:T9SS type A sorting domain-containing protein n=1 Tax=Mariniflexile aquimaris TaxID=881009 RepID=A0ABW3BXN9_9FLAO